MSRAGYNTIIIVGMTLMVMLAIGAYLVVNQAEKSRSELPILGQLPSFELTERSGEPFGTENLRGRVHVFDFIFTSCQGPCPVMAVNMGDLYRSFAASEQVRFVSITVDPDFDSPEVLEQYAQDQGVTDDRWLFLRGDVDTVAALCENGFLLAADDLPGGHSTKFVLVDDQARIRGYYSGTDEASMRVLKEHLSYLIQQMSP
jgi:protein SCO1/2